jgi:RimJ/RimL family protein N-acetyltransferase
MTVAAIQKTHRAPKAAAQARLTGAPLTGTVRKLWANEQNAFRDHLLRLDKQTRRMRFAHSVADAFIEDYAARMADNDAVVYAYVEDGQIHATAELRKIGDTWGTEAEAAFAVEATHQGRGLGTDLMGRVIRAARNRGVHKLYMSCLAENTKMQAIARKHEAALKFEYGEVMGQIVPQEANYFSMIAEAVEDRVGYLLAVLDLSARRNKSD